jgi:hypothetical protein
MDAGAMGEDGLAGRIGRDGALAVGHFLFLRLPIAPCSIQIEMAPISIFLLLLVSGMVISTGVDWVEVEEGHCALDCPPGTKCFRPKE